MTVGAVLAVPGLLLLLMSLTQPEELTRSAGIALLQLGFLLIALGFYGKAREVEQRLQQVRERGKAAGPGEQTCSGCKTSRAVLACTQHGRSYCLVCVARHDTRHCTYVFAKHLQI